MSEESMEATAVKRSPGKFAGKSVHLATPLLRSERMPHIWCPGCGIGTTVNCRALLADLALEATRQGTLENPEITLAEVGRLLAAICQPRARGSDQPLSRSGDAKCGVKTNV